MKKHQKIIYASLLAIPCALVLLQGKAGAISDTTFSQRIRPLQCVVSTIEIGGISTISYSPACGESVAPRPVPSSNIGATPTASGPAPVTGVEPPVTTGGGSTLLLNNNPAIYSPWGLTLVVKQGAKHHFYLEGDNTGKSARTVTVVDITEKGVLLRFEPGGITRGLVVGDKAEIDLNGDGIADIRIHLMAVDGQVGVGVLRVVLYRQLAKEQTVIQKWYQQFIIIGIVALLTLGVHLYHRRKLPHLHAHWHVPHNYRFK